MLEDLQYWLKNRNWDWKYKLVVCLPLAFVLCAIDWGSKIAVQLTMTQGQVKGDNGFCNIQYQVNPGSAYGANAGNVGLSIGLAAAITFVTLVIIIFLNDRVWLIPIMFIFSGSFANLISRAWAPAVTAGSGIGMVGQKGGVVDFLHWNFGFLDANGYVFNMADFWVTLGIVLLVLCLIYEIIKYIVMVVKKHNGTYVDVVETIAASSDSIGTNKKEEKQQIVIERQLTQKELKAKQKLEKLRLKNEKRNQSKRS